MKPPETVFCKCSTNNCFFFLRKSAKNFTGYLCETVFEILLVSVLESGNVILSVSSYFRNKNSKNNWLTLNDVHFDSKNIIPTRHRRIHKEYFNKKKQKKRAKG